MLLLIDALKGPTNQDRRLAGIALEERKALIIVGNKYDLVRELGEYSQPELAAEIHAQMPFASFAPVTFLSALTKRRLQSLMPLVEKVAHNLDRRIPTAKLNTIVRDAVLAHPPPIQSGKPLKILYVSQPQTHPPLFVFHVNDPELVPASYRRFIENTLRGEFDFEGVPLTLEFRSRRAESRARGAPAMSPVADRRRRGRRRVLRGRDSVRRAGVARVLLDRLAHVGQREHRRGERAAHARKARRGRGAGARRAQRLRADAWLPARWAVPSPRRWPRSRRWPATVSPRSSVSKAGKGSPPCWER